MAASLIDGQTCHSATLMTHRDGDVSANGKKKLEELWKDVDYNITDEISMIGKRFLARMSKNISIGKTGAQRQEHSFGGLNFIVTGDFFQFPPVACSPREALYWPCDVARDPFLSQIGRTIYEEFVMVVTLKQQMRVSDPTWHNFLHRLRYGELEEGDINVLRSLVLTLPNTVIPDFDTEPWKDVVLVTPRHGVREEWNNASIARHCKATGQQLLVSPLQLDIKGTLPTVTEQRAIARHYAKNHKRSGAELQHEVKFAIGMRVFVTRNIDLERDLSNGARGVITDVLLHREESSLSQEEPLIHLQHPPAVVFVRLDKTRAGSLPGLESKVVPIEPIQRSFRINFQDTDGGRITRTVHETQLPITAAYACTDYRAQGQTLSSVIVDISFPPPQERSVCSICMSRCPAAEGGTIYEFCETSTANGSRKGTTNIYCWKTIVYEN